jgi:hypothetical protein
MASNTGAEAGGGSTSGTTAPSETPQDSSAALASALVRATALGNAHLSRGVSDGAVVPEVPPPPASAPVLLAILQYHSCQNVTIVFAAMMRRNSDL